MWWLSTFLLPDGVDPEKVGALLKVHGIEVFKGPKSCKPTVLLVVVLDYPRGRG